MPQIVLTLLKSKEAALQLSVLSFLSRNIAHEKMRMHVKPEHIYKISELLTEEHIEFV